MPGVFISYRRSDTAPHAARLKTQLDTAFGAEYVFMDVDSLKPGEPFKQVIEKTIESVEVVLALIGHDWVTVTDAAGNRRLENPADFVRLELATAFRFDRVVIPVLLEDASMPHATDLPEELVPLRQRHAIAIGETGWDGDVDRLARRLWEVVDTIPPCPYPGMVAFGRDDAERFFGRDREIAMIEERLASQQVLCLVGPSGCGKSSLIQAGVLADLERNQAASWTVRTLRPGGTPMSALGEALGSDLAVSTPPETVQHAARQVIASGGATNRLLLVVDQLEELFAQADDEQQARFIDAIGAIHELDDVSIVFAIRADFYGELMESTLWPLVEGGKVDVPPLAGAALAEAIVEPARTVGVTIEPDLLERLVADTGNEPGALPLLQEALVRLWGTMHLHRISLAAYEQIGGDGRGGLAAAVADTADAALASLSSEQAQVAKRVLLRLVQFGEGRPDTRRQLRLGDLRSEDDDEDVLGSVLEVLARSRLVTLSGSSAPGTAAGAHGEDQVDLAHEALIGGWPTMRGWLAERREAELARRRLEDHVATWEEHERSAAFLDDVQLREARRWLAGADAAELGIPRGLSELVAVSAARLRRRTRLRRGAIAGLVVLLLTAVVLAGVFLRARNDANHRANVAEAREYAASAVGSLSVDPQDSLRLALDAVDALAADDAATAGDRREAVAALREAVHASRVRAILDGHTAAVVSARFDASGRRVVTAGQDGKARVWDPETGDSVVIPRGEAKLHFETASLSPGGERVLTAGGDAARVWDASNGDQLEVLAHDRGSNVVDAGFSRDGSRVVSAGEDGTARVWDAATGERIALLGRIGGSPVRSAAFDRNGTRVATGDDAGRVVVWDVARERSVAQLDHDEPVTRVVFGRGGAIVATSGATARVWRPFGRRVRPVVLRGHQRALTSAEFSRDGTRVVTGSFDGTARVWDAGTGKELTVPLAHDDVVTTAGFSPDGLRVVTASADQTARIWDVRSGTEIEDIARPGQELAVLRGHDSYVSDAMFSRDGKRIVTASYDGDARVWDATVDEPIVVVGDTDLVITEADLSPDGKRVVVVPTVGDPRVLDASARGPAKPLQVHGATVSSARFSSGGRDIVTTDSGGDLRVWDAATGGSVSTRKLQGEPKLAVPSSDGARIAAVSVDTRSRPTTTTVSVWDRTGERATAAWHLDGRGVGASFDAVGRRLLVWTHEGDAVVWDVDSGRRLLAVSNPRLRSAALTPDGTAVVSVGDEPMVRTWDVTTGQETVESDPTHTLAITGASFSGDGRRLLTASRDTTARIRDARTGVELVALRGHNDELEGARFDPTGRWVVTAGLDRTARVWDAQTGQEIAGLHHPFDVMAATLDRNGRRVLTVDSGGRARLFRCETCVPLDDLVRLARSRLLTRHA